MRAIRMNDRSRYKGCVCHHCGKKISNGRIALCTTFYVPNLRVHEVMKNPSTQSLVTKFGVAHVFTDGAPREIQIQVSWHRACVERILDRAPREPGDVAHRFATYKSELLARYEEVEGDEAEV